MRKHVWLLIVIGCITLIFIGCSTQDQQSNNETQQSQDLTNKDGKNFNIVLGHPNPESHTLHKGYLKFKELVEERTEGNVKVEIHSGGALGGDRVLAESVDLGTVNMALNGSMSLGNYESKFRVFDLPFLFNTYEDVDKIIEGEIGEGLLGVIPNSNIRVLAYPENGFRCISNNNKPIHTLEDLQGLKIRVMETPVHLATFEALGAIPTPIAFPEVYSGLQSKLIDGQENSATLIKSAKLYEVQPYVTKPGPLFLLDMTIINENFYQSLPKEYQDIIQESALEAAKFQRDINRVEEDEAYQFLMDEGIEVIELDNAEVEKFKEKTSKVYDEFKDEIGIDFMNKVLKELGKNPIQ